MEHAEELALASLKIVRNLINNSKVVSLALRQAEALEACFAATRCSVVAA